MKTLGNLFGAKSFLLFVFFYCCSVTVIACPCFNHAYLEGVFHDEKVIKCQLLADEDIIYKIVIYDIKGDNKAESTPTTCSLNAPYQNVYKSYNETRNVYANYDDFYKKDQLDCIKQILDTCTRLKAITRVKAEY